MIKITENSKQLILNNLRDSIPEKFDNLGQLNEYFIKEAPYYTRAIRNIFAENGIIPEKNEDELISLGIEIAKKLPRNIDNINNPTDNDIGNLNNISNVLNILTALPINVNNMFTAVFSKFKQCTTLDDLKNDLEKHPEYIVGINHFLSDTNVLNVFNYITEQLAIKKRWDVNDMDKTLQNSLDSTYTDIEENLTPEYNQAQANNNPTEVSGENSDNHEMDLEVL